MPARVRVIQATEAARLEPDETAVVVDVLRATTTACVLTHGGARAVHLARTPEEARAIAATMNDPLLVGERAREALPGFLDNSPALLQTTDVRGRDVVFTTTNGTQALLACRGARRVYAGALANARALAQVVRADGRVAIVASGWLGKPCQEDDAVATYLAALVQGGAPPVGPVQDAVRLCYSAGKLREHGRGEDVEVAAHLDRFPGVPRLEADRLLVAEFTPDAGGRGTVM